MINFIKIHFSFIIIFLLANSLVAQSNIGHIGLRGIPLQLGSDQGEISLFYGHHIHRGLSLNISTGYNRLKKNDLSQTDFYNLTIFGRYEFIFKNVHPFFDLGIGSGLSYFESNKKKFNKKSTELVLTTGLGMAFPLTQSLAFTIGSHYNYTTSKYIDGDLDTDKDAYLSYKAGFIFKLGGLKKLFTGLEKTEEEQLDKQFEARDRFSYNPEQIDSLEKLSKSLQELDKKIKQNREHEEEYRRKINALLFLIENKKSVVDSIRIAIALQEQVKMKIQGADNIGVIQDQFNKSMKLFLNRNYSEAAFNLKSLLDFYSDKNFASVFAYWIGESYYGMGAYDLALKYFNKVNQHKQSKKKDDALLMSGLCLLKMGQIGNAKNYFRKLINNYPGSEYYKISQFYIN